MKRYKLLALLSCLLATSCDDDFLDKQPLDVVSNETFWQTEQDAISAVNNCYRYLGDSWYRVFLSAATDDSYSWSNWPADVQYAGNGSATASTSYFSHFWSQHYNTIAAANNVLDNIDKVTDMSGELRARLKAETTFIRAYAYQQLVGMYGDVPLITHIQSTDEFNIERTPKAEVVAFIVNDLTTAAESLPLSYDAADQGRITKGAALALKARTLLYQEEWAEAATAAKAVMDLGQYTIDDDYLSLFDGTNKNSHEIILAAQYLKSTYPTAAATWVGTPSLGGWGQVVPLQSLVNAYEAIDGKPIDQSPLYDPNNPFENRDPRLKLTVVVPGVEVNGVTIDITNPNSVDALGKSNASFSGYYYKKYIPADIEGNWDSNSYNDEVLIRYAEVLLTYAEAKIEANEIDQSVYDAINLVRGRQGINMPAVTPATAPSQEALRQIVRRERHVEFALEEHRLFDIRRWGIAEDVMSGNAYGILNNFNSSRSDYGQHILVERRQFDSSRDYLWAIPQNEVDINPNLEQNPGW
ncbi:RagB/SusD family nutrient uptake outer membrane protein [Pontibacter silvestris]|uniref:RagB/SusD family nutrient uptake outer membrane protein n=1 Tax=Pontibacter silvestris TaxID=2305183 RepID=A0ABW4WSP5_9BACT|nr:RagB/SusD family nutrient uptake outer membrane protein [Pontibacter silvestris]MCC9138402.1 RagB/SusD family nutrient uptake outer membrane protein [Pontibacter silvestris]